MSFVMNQLVWEERGEVLLSEKKEKREETSRRGSQKVSFALKPYEPSALSLHASRQRSNR